MIDFSTIAKNAETTQLIALALAEDVGAGDITSKLLIPEDATAEMGFVARGPMVACGVQIPALVYAQLGGAEVQVRAQDGQLVQAGDVLAMARGNARTLLVGERTALNIMQRMSGVATLTRQYVDAVAGTGAVILDTRKTMPAMRALDKFAVTCGGGQNHRMRLDDMVLIKDNHIALCGGVAQAIAAARTTSLKIVVECDTLAQVEQAAAAKPDRILLDNMDVTTLKKAVALVAGRVPLEASGNVSLQTVRAIAETGVNYISIGKLTHSAPAADIGADITFA